MIKNHSAAFTLLELMVALTVLAILAAIAVPNFLEAYIRSKVARSRIAFATLAEALEAYRADHLAYPPNLEPFHPAPGMPGQPVSRMKLPLRPALSVEDATSPAPVERPASNRINPFAPPPKNEEAVSFDPEIMMDPRMMGMDPMMMAPPSRPPPPVAPRDPSVANDDWETSHLPRPHLDSMGGLLQVNRRMAQRHWQSSLDTLNPPGGKNVSIRIMLNGFALTALTTPIAYLGNLQIDLFSDSREMPVGYFSYDPYFRTEGWTLPTTGAFGNMAPRYLLFTPGPNKNSYAAFDPYVGPFLPYDPTNGTVSTGRLFALDGVFLR